MGKIPTSVSNDLPLSQDLHALLAGLDLSLPDLLALAEAKNNAADQAELLDFHAGAQRLLGTETNPIAEGPLGLTLAQIRALPPDPDDILEGLLPVGAILLAGPPKVGKSLLALYFAMAVAAGGAALGREAGEPGRVVYATTEDGAKQVQARADRLEPFGDEHVEQNFKVWGDPPRLDDGLLERVEAWADETDDPPAKLVVFDLFRDVVPPRKPGTDLYEEQRASVKPLNAWAVSRGLSVLLVHHTNKRGLKSVDDPFDLISGTTGYRGATTANLVLVGERIGEGQRRDALHVENKRGAAGEYALTLTYPQWTLADPNDAPKRELSDEATDFLAAMGGEVWAPADLAEAVGKPIGNIKMMLRRLVDRGYVNKVARGQYQRVDL